MNKKLIVALIAVILMAAMLCTSCGGGNPKSLVGTTWVCTFTAEQLKEAGAPDGATESITITFIDETRYSYKTIAMVNGEEAFSNDGEETYTYKDGKLTISDSGYDASVTVEGNSFTIEDSGMKLVFKKK